MLTAKLAAVALAAVAAGVPAPGHRYGLTLSPAFAPAAPGHSVTFTADDTGHTVLPLQITATEVVRHGGRCVLTHEPVPWAHASPARFILHPGQSRHVVVAIAATGPRGSHDLAINAATPVGTRGQLHIMGDVVGQAAVTFHGRSTAPPCLRVVPGGSRPLWPLAGLLLPLGAVPAGWVWLRRRDNSRAVHGRRRSRGRR